MIHIQNPVNYRKFRHIQPYCGIFTTLCNSCIFKILSYFEPKVYSELCQGLFRTLCNTRILRTLPYSEFWHLEDPRHIQCSVSLGTFRHIQIHSIMIVLITLNSFLFFFFFLSFFLFFSEI